MTDLTPAEIADEILELGKERESWRANALDLTDRLHTVTGTVKDYKRHNNQLRRQLGMGSRVGTEISNPRSLNKLPFGTVLHDAFGSVAEIIMYADKKVSVDNLMFSPDAACYGTPEHPPRAPFTILWIPTEEK